MPGAAATLTVGSFVSQCAVTTTNAFGGAGRLSTTPARNSRSLSQACGPNGGGDSIQKQGPPPCGRKNVGWREEDISWGSLVQFLAIQGNASACFGKYPRATHCSRRSNLVRESRASRRMSRLF